MEHLITKYNKNPIVGDLYTLPNLKVHLDDLLEEYLCSNGCKRSYFVQDILNVIGVLSTAITAIITYMSMYCQFDKAKLYLGILLLSYITINSVSFVISYFNGNKKVFDKFWISTRMEQRPVYVMLIYQKENIVPIKYNKSVYDLYYDNGILDHKLFLNDLKDVFNKF